MRDMKKGKEKIKSKKKEVGEKKEWRYKGMKHDTLLLRSESLDSFKIIIINDKY